jgi:chaperonin GroES
MFRAIQDVVVIKRDVEKQGIIIIPGTKKLMTGVVVAAGPGKDGKTPEVKVGDRVTWGEYAGQAVTIDGEEHVAMREPDIMGIFND